jgi:hypothetical protein
MEYLLVALLVEDSQSAHTYCLDGVIDKRIQVWKTNSAGKLFGLRGRRIAL